MTAVTGVLILAGLLLIPCAFMLYMVCWDMWKDSDARRALKALKARIEWRRTLKYIEKLPEVKK